MSTQYRCVEKDGCFLEVDERSSRFDIDIFEGNDLDAEHVAAVSGLSAEELVECAVKMIQPALYNVENPEQFFKDVVLKKINSLFR